MKLTKQSLAKMIDQTLLKPYACEQDFKQLCEKSKQYGFKMVAINPAVVKTCLKYLEGSEVLAGAAIGFPLGQNTIETKAFETEDAIANGSGEIDYVINIGELKNKNYAYIKKEMETIVGICKKHQVTSKVIFENCYLTDEEKVKLCEIALEVRPDFIKTSTGFGTGGATLADVNLMKSIVKDQIKVKASGGIRDLKFAQELIDAGVERIGTSCGVEIVDALAG
jgi:deoxyribose-phosphate aldolase